LAAEDQKFRTVREGDTTVHVPLTLSEQTKRYIQYLQIDFIRLWKVLDDKGLLGSIRRKQTPVSASRYSICMAEDVLLWLFRRSVVRLFPKPRFSIKKRRYMLEYTVKINAPGFGKKWAAAIARGDDAVRDACLAVQELGEKEAGFLSLRLEKGLFYIAADGKAGAWHRNRRRTWRDETVQVPESDFCKTAEAILSWAERLLAAIDAIEAWDPEDASRQVPDRHQREFEEAMSRTAR